MTARTGASDVPSWFRRGEQPPADAVAAVGRDDRVLSWADTDAGTVVVASQRGIWWPDVEGLRLIEWQHVDKAIWRDGRLTVIEADVVDDALLIDRPPVSVTLVQPRDLPPTLRKRVEANIVSRELLSVGGGAVRFVSRRRPGRDGVVWWAHLEAGTPDTPQVRSAVMARLGILRAQD